MYSEESKRAMMALKHSPELMKMIASVEKICRLKVFLGLALVAILFSGAKPF